jgi:hypothetical protein
MLNLHVAFPLSAPRHEFSVHETKRVLRLLYCYGIMFASVSGFKVDCPTSLSVSHCAFRLQINCGLPLVIDDVAPNAVDSGGEPVDARLYATFWGLQAVFKVCAAHLVPGTVLPTFYLLRSSL